MPRIHLLSLPIVVLGFTLLLFIAIVPFINPGANLEEGAVAARTIRAPRDLSFVSEALTERRQDEAAAAVQDSLTYDPGVAVTQQTQLNNTLSRIRNILEDPNQNPQQRRAAIDRLDRVSLSTGSKDLLQSFAPPSFDEVETESRRTLGTIFERSLSQDDIAGTREQVVTFVSPDLNRELATLVAEIVRPFVAPNLVVDKARTEQLRAAARAGVAPWQVAFAKDQVIVERDSIVTPEAREALLQTNILDDGWNPEVVGASAILALLGSLTVVAGWRAFRPTASVRQIVALALAVAAPVAVLKLYIHLILPDDARHFFAYALPVAASSMVVAGFVGAELALISASLIAFLAAFSAVLLLDVTVVGVAGSLDVVRIAMVSGLSGAAGVFAVRNAERLTQFLVGGLVVGLTVLVTLLATWLIDSNRDWTDVPWIILAATSSGVLSAFLAAGVFVTLGQIFGVTTRLQLLEMSQLSQPLLLRLQDEAPSTFQHSVIVANLAEKGALVIGADSLLARVGCYYHDIGKLVRPGFFIENQLGGRNPHDALDPEDSARIITDHVNDGIALGRQYKVPERVVDFIPEHHGTRVVSYFYREASKHDPDVNADNFRYPGPKPQSRETAIAMLADGTEAAVRASSDHSFERIDAIVDNIFAERLNEGQLDDSELTLRNLRALAESFKETLHAVYHPRIEYPAPTEAELLLRRRSFRASQN